jgi:hypothetical protein
MRTAQQRDPDRTRSLSSVERGSQRLRLENRIETPVADARAWTSDRALLKSNDWLGPSSVGTTHIPAVGEL